MSARKQISALLDQFPGPVTLTVGAHKNLAALALGFVVAAFFAWLLSRGQTSHWLRTAFNWIGLIFFAALGLRALLLLIVPRLATLTLDADGFEIITPLTRKRYAWRDVSRFRATWRRGHIQVIAFDAVVAKASHPGAAVTRDRELKDNYSLPWNDLTRLMKGWRERALARNQT